MVLCLTNFKRAVKLIIYQVLMDMFGMRFAHACTGLYDIYFFFIEHFTSITFNEQYGFWFTTKLYNIYTPVHVLYNCLYARLLYTQVSLCVPPLPLLTPQTVLENQDA